MFRRHRVPLWLFRLCRLVVCRWCLFCGLLTMIFPRALLAVGVAGVGIA